MNPNDEDFERVVSGLLEENVSDISDTEDRFLHDTHCLESDHDTASELCDTENQDPALVSDSDDEPLINLTSNRQYFLGKKVGNRQQFKWYKDPFRSSVRTPRHNIVEVQRPIGTRDCSEKIDFWNILFSEDILQIIVLHSNRKLEDMRQKYKREERPELKNIDIAELCALFVCWLYTAIFKSNKEDIASLFATDGKGREIFRCVFSQKLFLMLLTVLRFDDPSTREERKKTDPATHISELYDIFISNCQKYYTPSYVHR